MLNYVIFYMSSIKIAVFNISLQFLISVESKVALNMAAILNDITGH